jgi:hypothetical protein
VAQRDWVCTACGTTGEAKTRVPGSFLLEMFFWIVGIWLAATLSWVLLLLPGAYTGYRVMKKANVCRACGAGALVPADSPVGRQLMEKRREARSA